MKTTLSVHLVLSAAFLTTTHIIFAQDSEEGLKRQLEDKGNRFWESYNKCDVASFKDFFTDDIEFYHDKGGITLGISALAESVKNNLCGSNGRRVRREALPKTDVIYFLRNGAEIYGAIVSGEHIFYVTEPGKTEWLDGRAKFTNLWLKRNGEFRMARVFSYDHQPVGTSQSLTPTNLSAHQLELFVGRFHAVHNGDLSVHREDDHLVLVTNKNSFALYPKSETKFFVRDRDLEFEFKSDGDRVSKLVVREHGGIVDEGSAIGTH